MIDREKLFAEHQSNPQVSIADHVSQRVAEVGRRVKSRKKIYLDTRYWVFLRDAWLGKPKRAEHLQLLEQMQAGVRASQLVCPVSDVAFMELSSQTDDATRMATGQVFDALSFGVALQTEQIRGRQELEEFLRTPDVEDARGALIEKSWTKGCFIFGPQLPVTKSLSREDNRVLQKCLVDELWEMPFSELMKTSSSHLNTSLKFEETAARLNSEMRKYQSEIRSFEQAFVAEVAGSLDVYADDALTVALQIFAERGHQRDSLSGEEVLHLRSTLRTLLVNAFRLAPLKMAKRMPTFFIHSMSHAGIRIDAQRKFTGNFLRDLHHGTAGVGYHDLMLTENPLRVLLTSGKLALDKTFGCPVVSDEVEALRQLGRLLGQQESDVVPLKK
ncbi:hypothetical protein [Hydrogenophaga crocea]|uniref:Uncharacterized protein n=1 Tax=Hydrogenophaga crocea TaxID=2716225 RepID=A0A6G8ICK2_9BURK|nr:hypothetical protein [Hydrogenophaga crocea]QIM50785.1 hypothetical protein G9Q37_00885 [Hydrogenophaga crocea]